MALLLRAPGWRRCLAATPARSQLSTSTAVATGKSPYEDMQDPSKTHPAYSNKPEGRQVPGPEDVGTEKEVKWGQNIPASAEQAAEEAKHAASGLAQSVEQAAGVLMSKAKDAAAAAARAVGLGSVRPEMSEGTMGAAGKMEHYASTGATSAGPASSREAAEAKYQEMADTEKPNFPGGERSVNEMFPEMRVAAGEQSNTPDRQREENEAIRRELRKPS